MNYFISYAITVCNEVKELETLLQFLTHQNLDSTEIVVLVDTPKAPLDALHELQTRFTGVKFILDKEGFQGDFSEWKNKLNKYCQGEYIVQVDADEVPSLEFVKYLPEVIKNNEEADLLVVPRRNTVEGLTPEDVQKWHWRVENKFGETLINYPDWQFRVYQNNNSIKWKGKVHERPVGYKKFAFLPDAMFFWHRKGIEKQRKQNELYSRIQNG